MADINRHGDTWRQVADWARRQRDEAVTQLIAGTGRDERLRGRIEALDELAELGNEPRPEIPQPSYD